MNIQEARLAFLKQWDKVIDIEPGKTCVEEQNTQLHIAVPGYNFTIYGGDSDEENLNYFMDWFCAYVNGELNIKTNNMTWFQAGHHIVLLWEIKED